MRTVLSVRDAVLCLLLLGFILELLDFNHIIRDYHTGAMLYVLTAPVPVMQPWSTQVNKS